MAAVSLALLVGGCTEEVPETESTDTVEQAPTGDFELRTSARDLVLVEGDESGVTIPISLDRKNGHQVPVQLSIDGASDDDVAFISGSFSELTLTPDSDSSQVTLRLAIADLPIAAQQRAFIITASDGVDQDKTRVQINVQPVNAPDVYLLIGQSNMVGFSGDGTRQSYDGGPDATNPRIKQLNVAKNDQYETFTRARDFTSATVNIIPPAIVTAADPLHVPEDPYNTYGKDDLEYIGLGLSFAKAALPNTSQEIVLVPAAWSGSAFCDNEDGPIGQWNAGPVDDASLGNSWLFERAVTRTNLALAETGGILRGILWHQGESDANDRCASTYSANLQLLVRELRSQIDTDQRGDNLRQPDANIPFVVGTMSRGDDERGELSAYGPSKQLIDDVHRSLLNEISHVGVSNHDDLIPANGFPCGNTSCVHFGAGALREIGSRYNTALREAASR